MLETKKDWRAFFQSNDEERSELVKKLVDEKRLTFCLEKSCYDIFFEYVCDGWSRHQYTSFINGTYFLKKEDAINFRDVLVESTNKRNKGITEPTKKKDYPVIHFKIEG